ncbi:MAG: hypothetical protein ACE5PO_00760, partial [Candidatus Bathyarchaeia archaeon]
MTLSPEDISKYPFTKEATEFVKAWGLKLEDLGHSDYGPVVVRALNRVKQAIRQREVSWDKSDSELETLSFPVAVAITKTVDDDYLNKRYALAEAKGAFSLLTKEPLDKILNVADSYGWRTQRLPEEGEDRAGIFFTDYLRNASKFHDLAWKLINRQVEGGWVSVSKEDAARLLQEEIRRHIELRLAGLSIPKMPEPLKNAAEDVRAFLHANKRHMVGEEPLPDVQRSAFPPCMEKLYMDLLAGKNLPHMGRFTLTAFLLNAGMTVEEMVKLFTSVSDFDARVTSYQVEHIAGQRGGGTKYKPLNCKTMQTHGLCFNPEALCQRITSPLSFYRRKTRFLRKAPVGKQWTPPTSSE